ncbi:MAG: hypothetical protein HYZ85_01900 [Candidatus Omnitrophica bacterium]|nr:hypothetical protein [Candidatus Omnitrophota bacterium]
MKNRAPRVSSEEELLFARCLKHDPEAIQEWGRRYARPLYGLLQSLCDKKAGGFSDLVPEVFAEMLESSEPFDLKEPLEISLTRALIAKIQKKIRKKEIRETSEAPNFLDSKLRFIFRALAHLSWNQKILLLLRDQCLLSHEEIADILDVPKSQIQNRLKEARLLFRKYLQEILSSGKESAG